MQDAGYGMWDASAVIVVRRVQDAAGEPANFLGSDAQPVAQMHRLFPGTKRGDELGSDPFFARSHEQASRVR